MRLSKHNIISQIKDSKDYFIVNLLSKHADVLTKSELEDLLNAESNNNTSYIDRGYVVDEEEEDKAFRKKYLDFLVARETDEVQLFFVPTYACNFSCSYCYQDEYTPEKRRHAMEMLDAFFYYVDTQFQRRKKYITVFGGEPLLNDEFNKTFILNLLEKTVSRKLDVAFVTNGYFLNEYIPLLKGAMIREVQVTLDGISEFHDKRRMLKGGGATFDKIVEGIDAALNAKIPVNLRMVIDKNNINQLPLLAEFAIDKGWAKHELFKTQLGRNYELHHCQGNESALYTRIEMYKEIYKLLKLYPYITEFHKPAFSISKFLFERGELPEPLFDSCPGTKTEWAFDYTGKIYSCTATVGKKGEELGTFYPEIKHNEVLIEDWQERDVLAIEDCKNCQIQLACGGGCASVAKNTTGDINTPDCRPVKELLQLGIAHYFDN